MIDCPTCDQAFDTDRGVKIHHSKAHGESIRGYEHVCDYCGETFRTNREGRGKYCGQECYGEAISGEDNPSKDPGRREKISQGLKQAHDEGRHRMSDPEIMRREVHEKRDDSYLHEPLSEEHREKISETMREKYENGEDIGVLTEEFQEKKGPATWIEVEETGHTVRSSLEAEVDRQLYRSDIEYMAESEPDFPTWEIDGHRYTPDFVVGDYVIEVKGMGGYIFQPDKIRRIAEAMVGRSGLEYVVVGSVELPADHYFTMDDLDSFVALMGGDR